MNALYRGTMSDAAMRRATTEIAAFVIDVKAPTMPPPSKTCSKCRGAVDAHAWMANATRRPWTELGIEIQECPHGCDSTLAQKINAAPVLLGTETGR